MSDVSTWNPLDSANTAAPPDGWPEFMMPAMVNNTGRMMMGAIKRMYDQQVSGAIVLPYLKLAGGGSQAVSGSVAVSGQISSATSVTTSGVLGGSSLAISGNAGVAGNINTTQYRLNGGAFADRGGANTYLYDTDSVWTIALVNDGNNYYANFTHQFNDRGNLNPYTTINVNGITISSGGFNVANGGIHSKLTILGDGPVIGNPIVDYSDVTLKQAITPATQGLAEILALQPVTFTRNGATRQELGLIAQDVQTVLPGAVAAIELEDGPVLGIISGALVAVMVNAFKQIDQRLTALEGGE